MIRIAIAALVAAGTALAAAAPANANFGVRVGTLVCDVEGGVGVLVASRKAMGCRFDPVSGPDETYRGTITRLGVDIGGTSASRVVWAVFAPTSQLAPGALDGNYGGVSAEVTPGVGLGANVLVGGFDSSINLQPVSVQGQTGANIAAGVAGLRLSHTPDTVSKP
jgi:hypothetical protein